MKKLLLPFVLLALACTPVPEPSPEIRAWQTRADGITIMRDDWGIAHVYGETDADAVFGMIYAQAEDDFNRIEVNYLNALGRLAEAEGEGEIWRDLRMKLYIDPAEMQAMYADSPDWLRALMDAWADGLNWYLHTHPETQPRVLDRFEPWMALAFSEGSIGGDIERISLRRLEELYSQPIVQAMPVAAAGEENETERLVAELMTEPEGSNGIAVAPSNTENGSALLLINPHTSFYFRDELQMVSGEGLNAYGAVTWGQFFIYQGFNENAGWMHTSTQADYIDEYYYDVDIREEGIFYPYGDEELPMQAREITVPYRDGDQLAERTFTVYFSHHGPVVRTDEGRWIAVRLPLHPVEALTQSYRRTRVRDLDEFVDTMRLHTNSSNNTLFADSSGNIGYFHANTVPERDTAFDWTAPVSGMDPATEWGEVHSIEESPNVINPDSGWVYNTNNWPYTAAGEGTLDPADFPYYMDVGGENPRGIHAMRVLGGRTDFTVERLREAAYDSQIPAFEPLVPALIAAWDATPDSDPLKAPLAEPIAGLREWDFRWSIDSVPTAVAIFWAEAMLPAVAVPAREAGISAWDYIAERATPAQHLEALTTAVQRLSEDFGSWSTPWGEINRFQRISPSIRPVHDDDAPSIPVGFTSATWGSLASFGARRFDTRRLYGHAGNSFVAVIEFGERVEAIAITAGGISGDPDSPHFNDQAERYATGDLRPVRFHREDVEANAQQNYSPGMER